MKNDSEIIEDEELGLSKQPSFILDKRVNFTAGKSLGANQFKKSNPKWDGRNVITGVIDDGISPHQAGFSITTDGKRKLIKRFSNSTTNSIPPTFNQMTNKWSGRVDETFFADFNNDGKEKIEVFLLDNETVCFKLHELPSCVKSFNQTGSYTFWNKAKKTIALQAEINFDTKRIYFSEGERKGDSHGEGVASVTVGHKVGRTF